MNVPPTERRARVLYVDDQEGNLVVFRATFKKYMDVVTATSGAQALEILAREEMPVVISDQRMDGMNGTEFLAQVRKLYPDTIRMLLTAYTDFDDVVRAINDGQVSRFITKPWERQDLLATIANANELHWKTKENRTLTEQLLHRERLAAIGQVTSGLVHELGNIAAVLSVAEDLKKDWASGSDLSRELDILQGGIDKFMVLVESLRLYSKGGGQLRPTRKPEDVAKIIARTLVVLRLFPDVRKLKVLKFDPPATPLVVNVDAKMIEQVLVNIIKNAAEECPNADGEVEISFEAREKDVVVRIRDNGPGIPPPAWERVWQGFFTTKGDKGTGLGLAMCRKIMEAHEGRIEFINNPTGGCTFSLTLPN